MGAEAEMRLPSCWTGATSWFHRAAGALAGLWDGRAVAEVARLKAEKELLEQTVSELTAELRRRDRQDKLTFERMCMLEEAADPALLQKCKERGYQIEMLTRSADRAKEAKQAAEATLRSISEDPPLLKSVAEAIVYIERLHGRRIEFNKKARRSAARTRFKDGRLAYKCLSSMAEVLHRLLISEGVPLGEAARIFKAETGFELAPTERGSTKKNGHVMRERSCVCRGQVVKPVAHVKCDKGGKRLRIYFHVDREKERIVVTHCGDHPETAGTRRAR